ncbi:hypothetical protein GCM10027599_00920 [Yimella radicis]
MTAVSPGADGLIWLTRGKSWGFRFVLDGGLPDSLPVYERAFERVDQDESTACDRVADAVALCFPDPQGRRDASGRVIPHDFVVPDDLGLAIESVDDGIDSVWPLVAGHYDRIWDKG